MLGGKQYPAYSSFPLMRFNKYKTKSYTYYVMYVYTYCTYNCYYGYTLIDTRILTEHKLVRV